MYRFKDPERTATHVFLVSLVVGLIATIIFWPNDGWLSNLSASYMRIAFTTWVTVFLFYILFEPTLDKTSLRKTLTNALTHWFVGLMVGLLWIIILPLAVWGLFKSTPKTAAAI